MALEDVLVVLQLVNDGRQRRMNFRSCRLPVFRMADRNVVLLRLDIKQAVDWNCEVVSPDVVVVDGDRYVLLLLRRVAQQGLHPFSQAQVILEADGQCGDDNPDDQCPIQENEEQLERDGITEDEWGQEEVADGDKEYQSENGACVMPDAPRLDVRVQRPDNGLPIEGTAARRHESEYGRHQKFVARIRTESERLQQIENSPDDDSIGDAVSQPEPTMLEGICTGKK